MKKYFNIILLLVFSVSAGWSQNISINTSGNPADASAILDLSSTTSGLLIPRMTTAERNAVVSPATGLIIYNTTTNLINFFDGTVWQTYINIIPTGTLVLLLNNEADVTGTVTTASVKSFVVPANIYSQIMVEVEIGLDQSGNNNAEWTYDVQYVGVTKATSNLKLRGNNVAQEHKILGVIKYSEAMTAGGTVQVNVTAVTVNGTWRILSFRVYGII
jgi:hypothetical protein